MARPGSARASKHGNKRRCPCRAAAAASCAHAAALSHSNMKIVKFIAVMALVWISDSILLGPSPGALASIADLQSLPHIVETQHLSRSIKTSHLDDFLLDFQWGTTGANLKWEDDEHALAVFPCAEAAQALLDSPARGLSVVRALTARPAVAHWQIPTEGQMTAADVTCRSGAAGCCTVCSAADTHGVPVTQSSIDRRHSSRSGPTTFLSSQSCCARWTEFMLRGPACCFLQLSCCPHDCSSGGGASPCLTLAPALPRLTLFLSHLDLTLLIWPRLAFTLLVPDAAAHCPTQDHHCCGPPPDQQCTGKQTGRRQACLSARACQSCTLYIDLGIARFDMFCASHVAGCLFQLPHKVHKAAGLSRGRHQPRGRWVCVRAALVRTATSADVQVLCASLCCMLMHTELK